MDISILMKSIAKQEPPHFNIWFGEEQKILDLYLDKILTTYKKVSCNTVAQALDQVGRKTFDNSLKCFVVSNDNDFTKAETKWEEVAKRFNASKNIIVCRYNDINKTQKFYKHNEKYITEFQKLGEQVLYNYVLKELFDFSENNISKLCQMCLNDYGRILLECNKIKSYSEKHKTNYNTSFKILLEQDAIYSDIGDITFKLTDAILFGDVEGARKYLEEANRKGEPVLVIAKILYDGFRNMLCVQGLGKDKTKATDRTGLPYWQIKKIFDLMGGYSLKELERNMLFCQEVEQNIKIGKLDIENPLDYLVLGCLKP